VLLGLLLPLLPRLRLQWLLLMMLLLLMLMLRRWLLQGLVVVRRVPGGRGLLGEPHLSRDCSDVGLWLLLLLLLLRRRTRESVRRERHEVGAGPGLHLPGDDCGRVPVRAGCCASALARDVAVPLTPECPTAVAPPTGWAFAKRAGQTHHLTPRDARLGARRQRRGGLRGDKLRRPGPGLLLLRLLLLRRRL